MYSGFPTKQLETSYFKSVFAMLFTLQRCVTAALQVVDDPLSVVSTKDHNTINMAYNLMQSLESRKKNQP